MTKPKLLIPDGLHIHERGFKSLIGFSDRNGYEKVFVKAHDFLKSKYGDYRDSKALFLEEYDELKELSQDDLFAFKSYGVEFYPLVQAELLSYLMPKENWLTEKQIPNDNIFVFNKAYTENKEDLLLNMAAAYFWLKFWKAEIARHKNVKACIVFSGSLIYVKTLMFLLQNTPIRVFVLEHFFTGNDYYFEEKYTHIANNSDIKFKNVFRQYLQIFGELSSVDRNKEIIKALNKLKLANNKNVKQPGTSEKIEFKQKAPTILILGQVINDFSILESNIENINSLQLYLQIIEKLLEKTNFNIVFKAHPWEKQKSNINKPLTKDFLQSYITQNYPDWINRIKIVEDHNLNDLIKSSDYVAGICTQSLIEAAYLGKKCFQVGDAFFGNYGFTHDCVSVDKLVLKLCQKEIVGTLTLSEYDLFLEFLTIILQMHLVSIHDSGMRLLKQRLEQVECISLLQNSSKQRFLSPSEKTELSLDQTKVVSATFIDSDLDKLSESERGLKQKMIGNLISLAYSGKKYQKFKRNPEQFFKDSRYSAVHFIGRIYFGR